LLVEQASCLFYKSAHRAPQLAQKPGFLKKPGFLIQYLRQNKKIPFVGWVERQRNPTKSLGSTAFHPTYKKMAKVLLINTFAKMKNTTCRSGSAQPKPTKTSGSTKVRTTYKF
jgi:hypothetical protein